MRILHVIDSLKAGGAETILLGVASSLPAHEHHLVVLQRIIQFEDDKLNFASITSLDCNSILGVGLAALKFSRTVASIKPDIVHVSLPYSSAVVRLSGIGRKLPVLFSVHSFYSSALKQQSPVLYALERYLSKSRDTMIFVSEAARQDYLSIARIKGESHVLHNFISDEFFSIQNKKQVESGPRDFRRFVSVGNLKPVKNYARLIEAVSAIPELSLDIYGEGPDRKGLEKLINERAPNQIRLMGATGRISTLLKEYDAFILASEFEGFGIAPVEAIAVGLPVLLSNIPSFLEITGGNAIYFDPLDVANIREVVSQTMRNKDSVMEKFPVLQDYVNRKFRMKDYLTHLEELYLNSLNRRRKL
jgi:glycosyltransferase involved in cell wall biosynthesis